MTDQGTGDSYSDLIEDSIDDLNQGGDFAGTAIDNAKERKAKRSSALKSPVVTALGILALFSSGWLFYEKSLAEKNSITIGEANTQIQNSINDVGKQESRKAANAVLSVVSTKPEEAKSAKSLESLTQTLVASGVAPEHAEELKTAVSTVQTKAP
ncbi:MAG: hypothetical protein KDD66_09755 [Bdellovibrionales bacterium]|nr:hypothetical protein [Bdellovibrionales bacterium]